MMDAVGIERTAETLMRQLHWLESFQINDWMSGSLDRFTEKQITAGFMGLTSWLITTSALKRTESRGGHYRSDFPEERDEWKLTHIVRHRTEKRKGMYEQLKA
ncbi:hypothetical protein [Halobacillus salinarum]|uniref:hypothetical protein n=1 Tax=Halobacillus salinarum TaxID=2932257 RepID=UPI0029622D25|nr:hypothetical protein [Halobacillus salinarum]